MLLVVLGGGSWLGTPASMALGLTRKLLLLLLLGIFEQQTYSGESLFTQ